MAKRATCSGARNARTRGRGAAALVHHAARPRHRKTLYRSSKFPAGEFIGGDGKKRAAPGGASRAPHATPLVPNIVIASMTTVFSYAQPMPSYREELKVHKPSALAQCGRAFLTRVIANATRSGTGVLCTALREAERSFNLS
ncbi:hypothetical protein EVAR_25275_1 [Eumeta japonica]|uniref:Uncharacterized protein n=1 Tax=Eumeta variegata TaxID=151549 RepID=A0A4C1VP21_EUMVA|nr:hypothetical protein EVAR_25275_1 [Eumeta japonica]